jgi:TolB-like protein/DNA-binding winged helix-turn-helix (wHTH) protein
MQAPPVRRFDAFEINYQSGELRKNGMRLRVSGQPFQVLATLLASPGELVTREELHSKLWPADTFVDFDHGLNNAVARIREALEDSADTPRYIETIPRRGYRFIAAFADVRRAPQPLPGGESKVAPGGESAAEGASGPLVLHHAERFISLRLGILGGVAVLALLSFAFVLYHRTGSIKDTKQPAIKSLAVLPLKNLSGDATQEYLADGMTETLIGRLSRIQDLRVISRTSVMRFKETKLSVEEIAKALRVDALVEGSVIREGSRIRVHIQLIRSATDEHFWSEVYDRELRDALGLQSDVAQAIARKVEVTVKGGIDFKNEAGGTKSVAIDIKPGSSRNGIKLGSSGTIPVALLSNVKFNALYEVDTSALSFGHNGSELSLAFCDAAGEDVNGDGLLDLVCHFYASIAAFQPGDTAGIMKGRTPSGTSLYGKDSVQILPKL